MMIEELLYGEKAYRCLIVHLGAFLCIPFTFKNDFLIYKLKEEAGNTFIGNDHSERSSVFVTSICQPRSRNRTLPLLIRAPGRT